MKRFLITTLFISLLISTGCVIPESNHVEPKYHLLSTSEFDFNKSISLPQLSFYIQEVSLPPYLDDSRFIFRSGKSEVGYRESTRWAEPIGEGIARVIGINLSTIFQTLSYSSFPNRPRSDSFYEISLSIERFEKIRDNSVRIDAIIEISHYNQIVSQIHFSERQEIMGNLAIDEISALSKGLAALSYNVAKEIRGLPLTEIKMKLTRHFNYQDVTHEAVISDLNKIYSKVPFKTSDPNSFHFSLSGKSDEKVSYVEKDVSFYDAVVSLSRLMSSKLNFSETGIIFQLQ